MTETNMQGHTTPAVEMTEQGRKAWVAPQLERIPLNEAMANNHVAGGNYDAAPGYS